MSDKTMTKEQLTALIRDVTGSIVAERVEAAMAASKSPSNGAQLTGDPGAVRGRGSLPKEKGVILGASLAALAYAGMDQGKAIDFARKTFQGEDGAAVVKALEASTLENGGALLPVDTSEEVIEFLYNKTAVLDLNPTRFPLDSGRLQVPKLTASSTAEYVGEGSDIAKSQPTLGNVVLNAKKLAALVPISNSLIKRGGPRVATVVRDDVVRAMKVKADAKLLRGMGTEFSPKGLRYLAHADHVFAAQGSPNLAKVIADLGAAILKLDEANIDFDRPGWIVSPRTWMALATVRHESGFYAFRDELLRGMLWGYPIRKTNQVPTNLGSGSDSEVYLADFAHLAFGETRTLEVAISTEASYKDENGTLVSAFSLDQTVLRTITEHDLQARHDKAIAVLTGVTWEPGLADS